MILFMFSVFLSYWARFRYNMYIFALIKGIHCLLLNFLEGSCGLVGTAANESQRFDSTRMQLHVEV